MADNPPDDQDFPEFPEEADALEEFDPIEVEPDGTRRRERYAYPRLPWLIGMVAFVVYAATICRGVNLAGLRLTELVSGWSTAPFTDGPLLWLVTLPLRILPEAWIPVALNLQSAVLAAITLGFLTRCVQLLPFNRLGLQRLYLRHPLGLFRRRDAWVPAVLAAVLCGLDGSFWQEAVVATGAMLDLLLLVLAVWCLMEYRVSENRRWLDGLALVWGVAMAQNCYFIAAWPLMCAAIIWQLRLGSVSPQLWFRALCGWVLGFAIILVLPLVNSLGPDAPWTILHALRETVTGIGSPLTQAWMVFTGPYWTVALMVSICCMLPVMPLLFRLSKRANYRTSLQARIELITFQTVFAGFLLLELWVALHPLAGPQSLLIKSHLPPAPLLPVVFLNALGAAYLGGHFLIVSVGAGKKQSLRHPRGRKHRSRKFKLRLPKFLFEWVRRATGPGVTVLPAVMVAVLVVRNGGAIRDLNRSPFELFARWTAEALPPGGGVVLSDDPARLRIFRWGLARRPDHRRWAAVDVTRLTDSHYRAQLERRHPFGWLAVDTNAPVTLDTLGPLIRQVAEKHPVYYLHPSFGVFFELVNAESQGPFFKISPTDPGPTSAPVLSAARIHENEVFWDALWTNRLAALAAAPTVEAPPQGKLVEQFFTLAPADRSEDQLAVGWFSASLDGWGVALQHSGQWSAARPRLEQAVALNTNNLSARLNLAYNHIHQKDVPAGAGPAPKLPPDLTGIQSMLCQGGPIDTPAGNYLLGIACQKLGLRRQALAYMDRSMELIPEDLSPLFALAELYLHDHRGAEAVEIIHRLRQHPPHPLPPEAVTRLDLLEAATFLVNSNQAAADRAIQTIVRNNPGDNSVLDTAADIYEEAGQATNAIALFQQALVRTPDDLPLLRKLAVLQERDKRYGDALKTLIHAQKFTSLFSVQQDIAADRLLSGDLAGAKADYLHLLSIAEPGDRWHAHYGLAQVALQQKDSVEALNQLKNAWTNAPFGSDKRSLISRQIRALQSSPTSTELHQ